MNNKTIFLQIILLVMSFSNCSFEASNKNAVYSLLYSFIENNGNKRIQPKVITGEERVDGGSVTVQDFKALVNKARKAGLPGPSISANNAGGTVHTVNKENLTASLDALESMNSANYGAVLKNPNIPEEIKQRILSDQKKSAADFAENKRMLTARSSTAGMDDVMADIVKNGKITVAGVDIPVTK